MLEQRGDVGSLPEFAWVDGSAARFVTFKNGVRVFFDGADNAGAGGSERAEIRDMSAPSRARAAFAFGNAECSWAAMSVLTWRECNAPAASAVKPALAKLCRMWRERWGESPDGWIMEIQRNGVPHYHLFHAAESAFGAECCESPTEMYVKTDRGLHIQRLVVRGAVDKWLVGAWLECSGQLGDESALAFNRGGIIEMMRTPDAAGRYVAKESAKMHQKVLPARYAAGLGRWWHLAKRWEPRPRSHGAMPLHEWPWAHPVAHVWQKADIQAALELGASEPVPWCHDPKLWMQLHGYSPTPKPYEPVEKVTLPEPPKEIPPEQLPLL